jgi:hypothetical protein
MNDNLMPIVKKGLVYDFFSYYKLEIRFRVPMLATGTKASIWHQHVISKAKKELTTAKKLSGKITKAIEKHQDNIPELKEVEELKSIIRAYTALTGIPHALPDTVEELLELSKEVEAEFEESQDGNLNRATVFMVDENGKPKISSHMVLGMVKAVSSTIVNSMPKSVKDALKEKAKPKGKKGKEVVDDIDKEQDPNTPEVVETKEITTKVGISEIFAMDLKWVEDFMIPDKDILRLPEGSHILRLHEINEGSVARIHKQIEAVAEQQGKDIEKLVPALLERPILVEQMGQKKSSIALSQILPAQAKMFLHLRIRKDSPFNTQHKLLSTFIHGKNLGLGQWRGSGGFGAFDFRLFEVKDPRQVEVIAGEDEGWM